MKICEDDYEIDLKDLPSMNKKIYEILIRNDISEATALPVCGLPTLVRMGIRGTIAAKLIEETRELMEKYGPQFVMGKALIEEYSRRKLLTCGCRELNNILGGGFSTETIYEIYGPEKVGKTIFFHQMVCCAMLPIEQGGLDSPVIYFDSENGFSSKKLENIAKRLGLDPKYIINNTARLSIKSSDELVFGLEQKLFPIIKETGAKLILIDSIIANARREYIGAEKIPQRQKILYRCITALKKIVKKFYAVAIISNQITAVPSNNGSLWSYRRSGGSVIEDNAQYSIEMKFVNENSKLREFFIEKGADLPNISCLLKITDDGFHDP